MRFVNAGQRKLWRRSVSAEAVPCISILNSHADGCPARSAVIDRRYTGARRELHFQRVRLQILQRDKLQRRGMRRFQIYRRRNPAFQRIFPTRHTHAPFIARLQPGKIPFRVGRNKIVPIEHGKIEKLARHLRANRVLPHIAGASAAISITIKSSERIATT